MKLLDRDKKVILSMDHPWEYNDMGPSKPLRRYGQPRIHASRSSLKRLAELGYITVRTVSFHYWSPMNEAEGRSGERVEARLSAQGRDLYGLLLSKA